MNATFSGFPITYSLNTEKHVGNTKRYLIILSNARRPPRLRRAGVFLHKPMKCNDLRGFQWKEKRGDWKRVITDFHFSASFEAADD